MSEAGGPFGVWLANVTTTSAEFTGSEGRTYAFYTRATDHTGNVEAPPAVPDATIYVHAITGDVDDSGRVDLADAILALQVMAGIHQTAVQLGADVNGDQRIGQAEAAFILHKMHQFR